MSFAMFRYVLIRTYIVEPLAVPYFKIGCNGVLDIHRCVRSLYIRTARIPSKQLNQNMQSSIGPILFR